MRLAPFVVALVGLAGCGGGGERAETDATPTPRPPEIRGTSPLIPTEADGPAPKGAGPVIRSWAAALRRADWGRAADLVATGAHVQTGPELERLTSRNQVLAWNASLPCAAKVIQIGGAGGYAIVRFKLTERQGADCREGRGRVIRTAIRVDDGKIVGWYALT